MLSDATLLIDTEGIVLFSMIYKNPTLLYSKEGIH